MAKLRTCSWGCRDDLVAKSTCCSLGGPGFGSQSMIMKCRRLIRSEAGAIGADVYSNPTHCLSFSLAVLNHLAGSRSLPPWPPSCLCVCEGVLEPLPGAAVQQQQQEAGSGGHWMREVGVVCLLAMWKGSSGPAHGHVCLVWLASDAQSSGPGQTFFFFKRLET